MEDNNSESTVVLNVNHPPFDLKNEAVVDDEELQSVKSVESSAAEKDDSEIKNEIDEINIENRIQMGIIKRKPSQNNLHPITAPAIPDNFSLSNSFMKFFQSPLLKEILPMIDEVFRTLVENTKSIEGAEVENHKLFVSLNYRNVDEKNWHTIAQCVHDVNKNNPRLQLTHQPKVLEIHPVIDWNNETAVKFLREILRKGLSSNSDDSHRSRTDEDAFNSNKLYIGKISREQIFAVINFIVEVPTLAFEQLSSKNQILYGVLAMSFSIVTVIFSIAEFIYRGRTKAGAVWRWRRRRIPWLYYQSPSKTKLFGSVTDVIALVSAILQFIFSGIALYSFNRHKDNPVKISMWSPVFAFCVMWSQFLENSPEIMLPGIEQLQIESSKMAPPLKKSR